MSALIVPYTEVEGDEEILGELRDIFFESSTKKDFKDDAEKEAFYEKYLGYYLRNHPELAWVARGDRVLGYVVAVANSQDDALYKIQPHLKTFEKYFNQFPAHLHINCHLESRGKGVGGQLIQTVVNQLKAMEIHGLHIMTGPDALNKRFYQKLGFDFEVIENFHASPILFMGKSL